MTCGIWMRLINDIHRSANGAGTHSIRPVSQAHPTMLYDPPTSSSPSNAQTSARLPPANPIHAAHKSSVSLAPTEIEQACQKLVCVCCVEIPLLLKRCPHYA